MTRPVSSWPRRALLVTNLAMGVILVAIAWSNSRATERASAALARGHAELLAQSVERELREAGPPPTDAKLAKILASNAESGLRYVAVYAPHGRPVAAAGTPGGDPASLRDVGPGRLDAVGTRYRFQSPLLRPPPPGPEQRPPDDPPPGPPPPGEEADGPRPPPGRQSPGTFRQEPFRQPPFRQAPGTLPQPPNDGRPAAGLLVLDFESAAVEDLVHGSRWSLVLGVAAALLLTTVALVLWRQALEREQVQAILAQQKRLSALGEMAAVMAHEIRNPLASLKGNAEVLAELAATPTPSGEALARKASWIVKEAARLSALLDDLLDFSRSGPLERRPVVVADLLTAAAREVDDSRVKVDAGAAGGSWMLDPIRLRQLLTNLLRNALAASAADGTVELTASASPARLLISVRDHGDGLAAGTEARIFEPFFTTRSQGTGLGLAVSRRIAELHGGTLVARNHPGGGAELRLTLPAPAAGGRLS